MHPRILSRIRALVSHKQYVMTLHAEEQMNEDELTIFDVESALLAGAILARQKDAATGEWKYLVRGMPLGDAVVEVVCKFGPTGKLVIITVYVEN